jgi:D-lactate dehydrogenase
MISREVLDAFPKLELIAVRGRDVERVDLTACREKHVMVCRAPNTSAHAVAEFTFTLILALSRKVCAALARGAKGETSRDRLRGSDLYGKTLGVVGTGNIGKAVVAIGKGFGMKVLAWNPKQNLELSANLNFTYVPLESLLTHADIISVHVPYVAQSQAASTHHLLNEERFLQIKHGAYVINTSHPDIVDTAALTKALRDGRIGGVALDATGANITDEFARDERVLLTLRVAGYTQDALENVLKTTVENIQAFFKGFPQNAVGEKLSWDSPQR